MGRSVDYYFTPQSPWTYLGHDRFARITAAVGATVNLLPADYGKVFPVSGGLPLGQRAPQRQAYRLVDLARHAARLKLALNLKPAFFPVAGDDAARLIIAADREEGAAAAMKLCGAVFAAVWAQERNIADARVLQELLAETGLAAGLLDRSKAPPVQQQYEANTRKAIDSGVFGAPTYVVDGELFWGQDRLDFVEIALHA